jgi:fatty-acyl-CoA synthase
MLRRDARRVKPVYTVRLRESYFPAVRDAELAKVSIGDALRQAAADAGDVLALREVTPAGDAGRTWTYGELHRDAVRLAHALVQRHRPGDRVAIWAPNSPEWVLFEYAAALAGLVLVTVNPSFRARELRYVLERSRSSALYLVPEHRGNPMAETAAAVCRDLDSVSRVIDIRDSDAMLEGSDRAAPLPQVRPTDPAQIQYTSGTTGHPKGALLPHQGLYANGALVLERTGIRRGDVWLNIMPMFHTGGCALNTLGCLSARATMVVAAQFEPHAMNAAIEREKVTGFLAVPTMLVGLLDAYAASPRDVSSVRSIISGGSMVAPDLVRRVQTVFPATFQIIYGQTESCPVQTMVWQDAPLDDICGTAGQPLPHVELSIRDPATNEVVAIRETGEICARGGMNMLGYDGDPDATAKTLDAHGWLHTGDLGWMDERGCLRITGRLKEMIIRGGENLYPAEIENAMLEHPALAEVAVVGLPDAKFGEIVACFVRFRESHPPPTRDELVAFCRQRLSPQKTPAHWIVVREWPLTASGKIRKFELRDGYLAGQHRGGLL